MSYPHSYPIGSLVHHEDRLSEALWTVIACDGQMHLLRSQVDKKGQYSVIRANGTKLIPIVNMTFENHDCRIEGTHQIDVDGILYKYFH